MGNTRKAPLRGGVLPEKLGGCVRPASQHPYLFMTKICDIPYPIYDLTKIRNPIYDLNRNPVLDLRYNWIPSIDQC